MFRKRGPPILEEEEEEGKQEALKSTHINNGWSDNSSDSINYNEMQRTQGEEKSEKGSSNKHKRLKLTPLPAARGSENILEEKEDPEVLKKQEEIHHRMPKGFQMMARMGYKVGDTLGSNKNDQGLKEPIQPVANDSKKGLRFGMLNTSDQDDSLSTVLDEKSYRKWVSDTKTAQRKNILWQHLQKLAFEMTNDVEIYTSGQDPRDFNVLWRSYVHELNESCKKVPSITELDSSDDDVVANASNSDDDIIIASDSDDPIIGERQDEPSPEVESLPDDYDGEDEELDLFMQMDIDERIMRLNVFLRSELYYCIYCGIKYKDEEDMFKHCPGITEADHE